MRLSESAHASSRKLFSPTIPGSILFQGVRNQDAGKRAIARDNKLCKSMPGLPSSNCLQPVVSSVSSVSTYLATSPFLRHYIMSKISHFPDHRCLRS